MKSFPKCSTQPRSRGGMRAVSVAVVSCGALLLPAGGALADDMPGMNGTACPHASGEGPDALAAAGPNDPSAPERAPSESPIAPAHTSGATAPAAPKPSTKPTSEVTKPATQVPVQQPATTTVPQSAPVKVVARSTVTAVATQPVAAQKRVDGPRATRPARHLRTGPTMTAAHRYYGIEPVAKRSSVVVAEGRVTEPAAAPEPPSSPPLALLVGVLGLAGIGAVALVARRRRGGSAAVLVAQPEAPSAPSYADALIEAELHEIISEANARALLSADDREETPDRLEPTASR